MKYSNTRDQLNYSLLKLGTFKRDNKIISDYTILNHRAIPSLLSSILEDSDYIEYIRVENNSLIEEIAQRIYGNAKYWDIILLINKQDPLFDLPYEYDVVLELVEKKLRKYFSDYSGIITDTSRERLYQATEEKLAEKNEEFRVIKIIRPSRLQDFLLECLKKDIIKA